MNASRQFEVSQPSIYKWMDQLDDRGESTLEGLLAPELCLENKKFIDENKQLKEKHAEKELKIRILEQRLKKSRKDGR